MPKKLCKFILSAFASLFISYSIYVYLLQTPTFLSRSRLVLAALLGGILFLLFWWAESRFKLFALPDKQTRWGVISLFALINLILAGFLFDIPYTYAFLPTKTVSVLPTHGGGQIHISGFDTELVEGVSLPNFAENAGWQMKANTISPISEPVNALVWRGKPGSYAEIEFLKCDTCNTFPVSWGANAVQMVDLSRQNGQERTVVRHEYPSLWWHKTINFLALEISVLLLALISTNCCVWLFPKFEPVKQRLAKHWGPISRFSPLIGLGLLTVISFGLQFQPVMFNDDWALIYRLYNGDIPLATLADRRPLQWVIPWTFSRFMPYHQVITASHLVQIAILFFSALMFYRLLDRILIDRKWFAFLAAALYLVFPTEYTRLYLTMIGVRPSVLLIFGTFFTLIYFLKEEGGLKSVGWMLVSILLMVAGLLVYEAPLGMALIAPVILILILRRKPTLQKIIALTIYYLTIGAFVYWKLVLQPWFYADNKEIEHFFVVDPIKILGRYLYAIRTLIGGFKFPYSDATWLSSWNVIILLAATIGCLGLYFITVRLFKDRSTSKMPKRLSGFYREQLWIMMIGVALWLAGYFPIILNYPPNIYGHMSRVNLFSIPGAVLILLALLAIFFRSVTSSDDLMVRGTTVAVLLMVFLGVAVQFQTQEAYNRAWGDTKAFYQQLFDQVPNLKKDTQVVFELTGYEDYDGRLYRPVYSSFWEGVCSLGMLYEQDDFNLGVVYRYQAIEVPPFPDLAILPSTLDTNTLKRAQSQNLDDWLVLRYNRQTNELSILEELPSTFGDDLTGSYQPSNRIILLDEPLINRKIVE